ncbi:hypothetical protein RUM43_000250 [Polyplax serrata]|uniref:Uncharacterized protein n=1 Tax=Polyplax serrata TaxID=468196 RepID=A0AAN8SGQ2_POLSC
MSNKRTQGVFRFVAASGGGRMKDDENPSGAAEGSVKKKQKKKKKRSEVAVMAMAVAAATTTTVAEAAECAVKAEREKEKRDGNWKIKIFSHTPVLTPPLILSPKRQQKRNGGGMDTSGAGGSFREKDVDGTVRSPGNYDLRIRLNGLNREK